MLAKFRSAVSKLRVRQREAARRQTQRRTLRAEPLEGRLLMTGDSWVVPTGMPDAEGTGGSGVDTDSTGSVYLAASVYSGTATGNDLFLAKYSPAGEPIWEYSFAIPLTQFVSAATVASDDIPLPSDGFYVAGAFQGTVDFDPTAGEVILQSAAGDQDGYLAKYSLSGDCLWARQLPDWFMVQGVATQDGDAYVVGQNSGDGSMSIVKFSAEGTLSWTKPIGNGLPSAIAIYRPDGGPTHIYVSGKHAVSRKADAVFVMELLESADGSYSSQVWSRDLSPAFVNTGQMAVRGEAVDTNNPDEEARIYLTTYDSISDTLVKLDSVGNELWSQQIMSGLSSNVALSDVAVEGSTVFLVGNFSGSANFDQDAANSTLVSRGNRDGFIARYENVSGDLTAVQRVGGGNDDRLRGLVVADGWLLTCGIASAPDADFLASELDASGQTQNSAFVPVSAKEVLTMRLNVAAPIVYNAAAVVNGTTVTLSTKTSAGTIAWYENNAQGVPVELEDANPNTPEMDVSLPVGVHQITAIATDGELIGMAGVVVNVAAVAPSTKFYVVDDATANKTFEYDANGSPIESYSLSTANTAPRGAASTAAGDTTWVVDANRNVYVYDTSGGLQRSWTAGTLNSKSVVEGIATNGTDVWIVDSKTDKVYRYANGALANAVTLTAASSFSLSSANTSPKDLVTDGTFIWVVNDSSADAVFKYDATTGAYLGSWTINGGGGSPTGITLDPSNASQDLWIVDSSADKVYQYTNGRNVASGTTQTATTTFALATGNGNPQGIADPPALGSLMTTEAVVRGESVLAECVLVGNDVALASMYCEPQRKVRVDRTTRVLSRNAVVDVSISDYTVGAAPDFVTGNDVHDDYRQSDVDDLFAEWDSDPLLLLGSSDFGLSPIDRAFS